MNGAIFWGGVSSVFLLVFIFLLALGIIRQQKKLVFAAVAAFVLFIFAGAVTLAELAGKAIDIVKEQGKQPSPGELYERALGEPPPSCVNIGYADMSDNLVTGRKMALCFSACPGEVQRMLSLRKYDIATVPTGEIAARLSEDQKSTCFTPARFGDTVMDGIIQDDNWRIEILISLDSMRVLYLESTP